MDINNQKIKIHIWIALILFLFLFLIRSIFTKAIIPYGHKQVTIGGLLFLFYGFYLIFISCLYFNRIFNLWKNDSPWKKELIKSYLLILLFCVLIMLLYMTLRGPITIFQNFLNSPIDFLFDDLPNTFFFVGLSIVFPISLYSFYLSIKSFFIQKETESYGFGLILMIISLILLTVSFISFWIVLNFWIQGGIKI